MKSPPTWPRTNPHARIVYAASVVSAEDGEAIRGKKVLVVEDGPTLTHGEMTYGAAHVPPGNSAPAAIVDPVPMPQGACAACSKSTNT